MLENTKLSTTEFRETAIRIESEIGKVIVGLSTWMIVCLMHAILAYNPVANVDTAVSAPPETAMIAARLSENETDYLQLDDSAWAVNAGGVSNRTLLVSEGNLFLEQVFGVLPGVEAFKSSPTAYSPDADYDLIVFDSVPLPDPLPAADILVINPTLENKSDLLQVGGVFTDTVAIRLADSPLLEYVDWRDVHIQEATAVQAPSLQTLVEAEGGPLLFAGEINGRRIAVLPFDLRASDLPLQIAFPILIANITGWLNPGSVFDASTSMNTWPAGHIYAWDRHNGQFVCDQT